MAKAAESPRSAICDSTKTCGSKICGSKIWPGPLLLLQSHCAAASFVIALAFAHGGQASAAPFGDRVSSCVLIEDAAANEAGGGGSDEELEDDEDDEGDGEKDVRGLLAADGVTCIAISGSADASAQTMRQTAKYPGATSGSVPYSSIAAMGLNLATSTPTQYGVLTTGFETSFASDGQSTLNKATIGVGPLSIGYDSSQFNYWTGDNFAGAALQPMPSSFQIARTFKPWENTTFAVSLESAISQPAGPGAGQQQSSQAGSADSDKSPAGGVVLSLESEGDAVSGKIAIYGRPSWTDSAGAKRPEAWAMNAGLEYDAKAFVRNLTIATQATIVSNSPELIGTRFERATIGNLNLPAFETLGWSGLISLEQELTDQWSVNAHASFFKFTLPAQPLLSGRALSMRGAANVSWSPADDFNIILEVSLTRLTLDLSGPARSKHGTGNAAATTLAIARNF